MSTNQNAKSQLLGWLHELGWEETRATFESVPTGPSGGHLSTALVRLPDGRELTASGSGARRSDADVAASEALLGVIAAEAPALLVDWSAIEADAQAGDTLLKLAGYLAAGLTDTSARSAWLQSNETNSHLAQVFDRWHERGDPDVASFGPGLGEKRKATLIEAILWRRHGRLVLSPDAVEQLRSMLASMGAAER